MRKAACCLYLLFFFTLLSPVPALDHKNLPSMPVQGPVWALPWLVAPEGWKTSGNAFKELGATPNFLRLSVTTRKGDKAALHLRSPQLVPNWADNLHLRCTNSGGAFAFRLDALVQDGKGREFVFFSKSRGSYQEGLVVSHPQRRTTELWHHFPAFKTLTKSTYRPRDGAYYNKPERPYRLLGLQVRGNLSDATRDGALSLYMAGFAFTHLEPSLSHFYYQFDDQEFYGELAPLPYLTPGQLFHDKWGKRFEVSWTVRAHYDGLPFLAGSWQLDPVQEGLSKEALHLAMATHLQLPLQNEGTYWVRVKTRWGKTTNILPEKITERDLRLVIDRGAKGILRSELKSSAFPANTYIRIAAERPSRSFNATAPFIVQVELARPEGNTPLLTGEAQVALSVRNAEGNSVRELKQTIQWSKAGRAIVSVDLQDQPAGSYELTAELQWNGKVFDRTKALLGRKAPTLPETAVAGDKIPDSVPSARELLSGKDPMLFLMPLLSDRDGTKRDAALAWNKVYKPFLAEAGQLSRYIEFHVPWSEVERLPGIYDWTRVDRFLNEAEKQGLLVDLWPEFRANKIPEWIPAISERDPQGRIFGAKSYLFHNTRPNFLLAPPVRERLFAFFSALVRHVRTHPALLGYYVCLEHPRDAPFVGWTEGFGPENLPFFQNACRKRFTSITVLNRRWGTTFSDFSTLRHPRKGDTKTYWTDWLLFRVEAMEAFLKDYVTMIRRYDPKRLILVYGDGIRDYEWFRDQGCMTADGGSHNFMSHLKAKMWGTAGFHRRTEDHNPGNWTAYFPSQVEASLFAVSPGGGYTTHSKAFVRTFKKSLSAQLADPSQGLGRLKALWPVWQELHQAHAFPPQAFILGDMEGSLAEARHTCIWSTFGGSWATLNVMGGQLNVSLLEDRVPPPQAKLIISISSNDTLPEKAMARLETFVRGGGTLVMTANAGRHKLEAPATSWALLTRLGFGAPASDNTSNRPEPVVPLSEEVFGQDRNGFVLRDIWQAPTAEAGGMPLATFTRHKGRPAITWKPLETGRVVVIWARTLIPAATRKAGENRPFLRDLAVWAGVPQLVHTDNPSVWANLQFTKDKSRYYGLIARPTWPEGNAPAVTSQVRWLGLPDGRYKVRALIAGKNLGEMDGLALRTGLPITLQGRAAEIYRFERLK